MPDTQRARAVLAEAREELLERPNVVAALEVELWMGDIVR